MRGLSLGKLCDLAATTFVLIFLLAFLLVER
jgi:hypothetical protein